MMRFAWLLLVAGCGRIGFNPIGGGGDDVVDGDGGTDGDGSVAGCKVGAETSVAPGTTDAWEAQLLWNGNGLGIAWSELMGEFEIMFVLANANGVPQTTAKNVSAAVEHSWFPQLAWSGNEFAVVWSDDRTGNNDVRFARLDATTGARIGADVAVTAAAGDGWFPTVAWIGGAYDVTWADDAMDNFDIWRAELSSTGGIVGGAQRAVMTTGAWAPVVVSTPTHTITAWGQDGTTDVHARFHDRNTALPAAKPVVVSPASASLPTLAWTGSVVGVAWQDTRDGMAQIYAATFDLGGNRIGAEHRITTSGPAVDPALAWSGARFGLVWEDSRSGKNEVYFAELDASGARVGPEVAITSNTGSDNPAIAWTGAHYVVAYDGSRTRADEDVYTRTVCIP